MSSRRLEDMSSRCLQSNNFSSSKTTWRRLARQKIVTLKKCWRRFQNMSWRRLQDVLKTNRFCWVSIKPGTSFSYLLCRYTSVLKKLTKQVILYYYSVLLLYSWVEERSSFSRMFKYWMLIMRFQMECLVFFDKILISLVKWFFIFDQSIMLDAYPCTFKICWVYPSHALNYIKNLKEEILRSRFQVVSFHESIMTNLTTRKLSMD